MIKHQEVNSLDKDPKKKMTIYFDLADTLMTDICE